MGAKQKNKISPKTYRAWFKVLRAYYVFGFGLPHYRKDFTPQQKSSISRRMAKLFPYFDNNFNIDKSEYTFLKYPEGSKLPHIDGVRTDAGIIYKWPQASLKKSRIEKNKWLVVINPTIRRGMKLMQKRRDVFFPFPPSVIKSIDRIQDYVALLMEKYKPHDIMWNTSGKRERVQYDPELFSLYFSNAFLEQTDDELKNDEDFQEMDFIEKTDVYKRRSMRKKHEDTPDYYTGVFFIYYL